MKKTMFLIAATSIMAAAVSCQKDQAVEKESNIASKEILTVTADIAQFTSAATKTSIKGSANTPQPVWSEGDEIKLFNTAGGSAIYEIYEGAGESSATFTPQGGSSLSGTFACAYYPAENATSYTHGTGITAAIPATQAYTSAVSGDSGTNAGTFAVGSFPMVGTGDLDDETGNLNLTFKNVFGLLQLNFTGSETIKQIDLIGSANLSGTATITATSTPSCTISSGVKYVTLTDINTALTSTSKAFYIAVPVGTISEIYITTATDLQSVTKSIEITRSNITSKNSATLSGAGFSAVTYSDASSLTPAIICGTVWAPVNCGYVAKTGNSGSALGYPYGKLYQWGRKFGQGYDGYDASYPTGSDLVPNLTSSPDNSKFYYYADVVYWYNGTNPNGLWDDETYDPCPAGWCVPTKAQLEALKANKSSWTTNTVGGVIQKGYWFSGSTEYSETAPQVFLPATGFRTYIENKQVASRGSKGYYWSKNYPNDEVNAYYLHVEENAVSIKTGGRAFGFAVRCIKQ